MRVKLADLTLDEAELTKRAARAYSRRCQREGSSAPTPSDSSGVVKVRNEHYVHLFNSQQTLAVYIVLDGPRISYLTPENWPSVFRK